MHSGIARRVVTIAAVRQSQTPVIPEIRQTNTDDNGIVETLMDIEIQFKPPELTAEGQRREHSIEYIATYALSRPPTTTERLQVGAQPYDALRPGNTMVELPNIQDTERRIYQ